MAISGSVEATASIDGRPPETASVSIDVQPRANSTLGSASYQVEPEDMGTGELPLHPEEDRDLGSFLASLSPAGDATEATTLIDGGPNRGVRYFTTLPGLAIVGQIWINRPALEPGSDFMALQTDCIAEGLLAAVEGHEGLPPVRAESHTQYFQDKFNQVYPGVLEPIAGPGDTWVEPWLAVNDAAYEQARTHSASLDDNGVDLGCDTQFF